MLTRRACLVAAALLCAALAAPAHAADPGAPESGWAYDLWNELMSPFCPGRSLADCPSQDAETLRIWILVQQAAGRSRRDVRAELEERYGDVLLAAPRARGFGITAYAIPIAAFLAGGALLAIFLRRHVSPAGTPRRAGPIDPELERAIDAEMGRW